LPLGVGGLYYCRRMNRRDALKTGVAAVLSIPYLEAASWKPALFSAHENETVIALTDLLIPATDTPGAKAALVNRYMDLLLSAGSKKEREGILGGLKWLDEESNRQFKTTFVKLSANQQTSLLQSLEAGSGQGKEFFHLAKSMTARIYYQTEIGFKELNKYGTPKSFGCAHTGQHA
jgi:hypothetical protein